MRRTATNGLSPRVRGNRLPTFADRRYERSIPACAVEPLYPHHPARSCGVYPRVCGGTPDYRALVIRKTGLSPRVRGNPLPITELLIGGGSIPACAGEPFMGIATSSVWGVYPRVCGGTAEGKITAVISEGLSPRVRGNLYDAEMASMSERSIPACAGEPARGGGIVNLSKVYPRVCGGTSSHPIRRCP